MFGPKWSQHIDKTRMLHDSIFISWISSSVAPTRTAPPEHSLFQGSFYFLHGETDVSLGCSSWRGKKNHLFHGGDRSSVTFGPLEWQGDVAATSAAARSERKARKALLRAPNVQTTVSACLKKRFVLATSIESQIDYVVVSRQLHS